MNLNENIKRLHDPFKFADVEWKIQVTTQDKARGMAVAYINSRAIQSRLDEVIGAANWKNAYLPWQNNAQICGISIFDSERNDWVTKYDGAENTDIEPVKGGLSDSFKRAACVWGIGRYLYQIEGIWVDIEPRGKGSGIKNDQYGKLEAEYNKAVAVIFPASPDKEKVSNTPAEQSHQVLPASGNAQPPAPETYDFKVQSVKPSGKESQVIELVNPKGESITAYIQKSDKTIIAGSKLTGVKIVEKDSVYGKYNVINGYKVAA